MSDGEPSTSSTSSTFGSWSDRLTYVAAEGQLLVLGAVFFIGALIVLYRPELPSVPPIVVGIMAALMLFGPPLLAFWVTLFRKMRDQHMVEVHEIDGRRDVAKQWYVPPETWATKNVEDASPYPLNGGSAWGVQSFEHLEDVDELNVDGVWLSETEDTKLMTVKSHFEAIYGKLTESHIALNIMRESVEELGADIQQRVVNTGAEARERGRMVDPDAVKDVFGEFENNVKDTGPSDLPTLDVEEAVEEASDEAGETTEEASADD